MRPGLPQDARPRDEQGRARGMQGPPEGRLRVRGVLLLRRPLKEANEY